MLDRQVNRPVEADDQDVAGAMDARVHLAAESEDKPGISAADFGSHLRSHRLAVLRRRFRGRERRQRGNH